MYDHYFSNFGSPPIPDDICKDSAVKKVKHQHTTILLAILVDLPSPMIPAKVQPQGILGSRKEDF